MSNLLPDDIPFERWVRHVFDHPLPAPASDEDKAAHQARMDAYIQKAQRGEKISREDIPAPPAWYEWYFQADPETWNEAADPARTVEYITRLFTNIDVLAEPYSDGQINQGINYLISNACSNHIFALISEMVPLRARVACAESFYDVYAKLYARKCTSALGHVSERGNPLNMTCYMWWDIIPFFGRSGDRVCEQLDGTMLYVMERTLALDHEACREGALHGLGHWHFAYPERVETVIDEFLQAHAERLSLALAAYARAARRGAVL